MYPKPPTPSKGMNTYTYKAQDGSMQSYNNSANYQNKAGNSFASKEAANELARKKAKQQSNSKKGSWKTTTDDSGTTSGWHQG
jgi:hypothetical protein